MPLGLRASAIICQRTTKAVIHIFTQSGFSADIYLDGFFDAKIPVLGDTALAAELRSYGDSLQVPMYPNVTPEMRKDLACGNKASGMAFYEFGFYHRCLFG